LVEIHFIGFRDMVFTQFSGCTDSLTHGRTDPNIECLQHHLGDGNIKIKV